MRIKSVRLQKTCEYGLNLVVYVYPKSATNFFLFLSLLKKTGYALNVEERVHFKQRKSKRIDGEEQEKMMMKMKIHSMMLRDKAYFMWC